MHGTKVSEEELDAFIDMSHAGGAVEEDEKRQIKNLLNLSDMNAGSVMTPRVNVEFLSLDMTIDEACDFLMKSSHSRLPVYGETTDDVEFVITFREAFQLQREGHGSAHLSSLDLEKIMKVSLTQALDDLFEKFQKSRRHMRKLKNGSIEAIGSVLIDDILEEFDISQESINLPEEYISKTLSYVLMAEEE